MAEPSADSRLRTGDHVRIERREGHELERFRSVVHAIEGQRLWVSQPRNQDDARPLQNGEQVRVLFTSRQGRPAGAGAFVARVERSDGDRCLLGRPEELRVTQRREYFRVDVEARGLLRYRDNYRTRKQPIAVSDLSVGGLGGQCEDHLEVGTKLTVQLEIADALGSLTLRCRAEVVRARRVPKRKKQLYNVGLRFLDASGPTKRAIADYVMKAQLAQIRRSHS